MRFTSTRLPKALRWAGLIIAVLLLAFSFTGIFAHSQISPNQILGLPFAGCADTSGSGTAQSCNTSPTFAPVVLPGSACVAYATTTTNSGTGLTVNVNSLGAKSVAIPSGSGWTTTLTASIIPANKPILMCYDGSHWDVIQTGTGSGGGSISPCAVDGSGNLTCPGYLALGSSPPTADCSGATGAVCGNETATDITPASSVWGIEGHLGTHKIQWTINGSALQDIDNVEVNGSALPEANLNSSSPAAPTNGINATVSVSTNNVSVAIVGDGTSTHYLDGTGNYSTPSGGSAGCMTPIQVIVGSATASISLPSIPATCTDLELTFDGSSSGTANDIVLAQINGDSSSSDYLSGFIVGTTGTPSGGAGSFSGMIVDDLPTAANYTGLMVCTIPSYTRTNFYKRSGCYGARYDASITSDIPQEFSSTWKNTTAISSITLILNSGNNFDVGTVATLRGK